MVRLWCVAAAFLALTASLIPFQWLSVRLRWPSRRWIPNVYHRLVCRLIGVRIRVVGACARERPLLVVANHVSWLDIPVVTAVTPVVFVAKREIASWPFFGLLAKLQRSVFVDRNRRYQTAAANAEIASRMAEGDPVVLFAEGTSSDGNRVLPFRSALIGAAREALAEAEHVERVLIQPLSIAYVGYQGLPAGRQHRPLLAWYGDLDLLPHLAGILRRGGIDVVVTWGQPIAYETDADRKALARTLETAVRRLTVTALRGRPLAAAPG